MDHGHVSGRLEGTTRGCAWPRYMVGLLCKMQLCGVDNMTKEGKLGILEGSNEESRKRVNY